MDFASILAHFDITRRTLKAGLAQCPSRDDPKASLSITDAGDRALLHDFSGCPTATIVAAVGLTMANLFFSNKLTAGRADPTPFRQPQQLHLDLVRSLRIARQVWCNTIAAPRTLVEDYLRERRIVGPTSATIRFHRRLFHSAGGLSLSAMVAAVQGVNGNSPGSFGRTLKPLAARLDQPNKMTLDDCAAGSAVPRVPVSPPVDISCGFDYVQAVKQTGRDMPGIG